MILSYRYLNYTINKNIILIHFIVVLKRNFYFNTELDFFLIEFSSPYVVFWRELEFNVLFIFSPKYTVAEGLEFLLIL